MRPAPDVLVIGDALLDVAVAPGAEPRRGGDVRASIRMSPGGQGANVAVRLARRRLVVALACAIGGDAAGRIVRAALDADAVMVDAAPTDETGVVVVVVDPDGERTMFSQRVALLPLDVDTPAAWIVVSGYALLEPRDLRLNHRGRLAILGCALPDGTAFDWWLRADEMCPDLVILNADEARAIGSDAATLAVGAGALVVVTEPDGVQVARPDPEMPVRRIEVPRAAAVDSTGAGDAFSASLISDLRRGPWPLDEATLERALGAAAAFAAQVAAVPGAQTRVPAEEPA
jgi:ribokinase